MQTLTITLKVAIAINAIMQCAICAPRRSSSSTTFDQKQTGEYNIQLHLKDFQIIAMVGDESFGNLGDYDYNYDYSDLTIKPSTSTTTTKKSTKPEEALSSTNKPEIAQSSPSTTTTEVQSSTSNSESTFALNSTQTEAPELSSTIQITLNNSSLTSLANSNPPPYTTSSDSTISSKLASSSTSPPTTAFLSSLLSSSTPTSNVPGQIPVIVQGQTRNENSISKDTQNHRVTIVPLDDATFGQSPVFTLQAGEKAETPTLGEILHYRKCAQGFQRDKRGRCRKVRRPQIPLGITKFASNIAARFRQSARTEPNVDVKDFFLE